jgi:dipeptidyl aminopeptidase/acylaminoacyl peptidase
MPKQPISLADLAKPKLVGDPNLSPDGARVVYTIKITNIEKNKYFTHLWLANMNDGAPRQFTFGEVSDTSPRWSPDGQTIAFIRNKDKKTQIWLVAANGGEPRQLTTLPEGGISELCWSPDGARLAFAFRPTHEAWTRDAAKKREENGQSNPPRVITHVRYRMDGEGFRDERQHLWVCEVATGQTTQITKGDYDDFSPAWSPDSATIAFTSNRSADPYRMMERVDIWLVAARGGAIKKVATPVGPKGSLAFSPDGKRIAYYGAQTTEPWKPHNDRLWVVSLNGRDARSLTDSFDRTMGDATLGDAREGGKMGPMWAGDGKQIFVLVSDTGSCHLYAVDVAQAKMTALTKGALDVSAFSADTRGATLALLIGEPTRPMEIHVGNLENAKLALKPLTHTNAEWLRSVQIGKPQEFYLKQADGATIQGWVIRPTNFKAGKKYPALLYVHGGPHSQYGNVFFHEMQYHAARGYVVVYTNPRGSNGRDEHFGAAIYHDWGNLDYQDVMAAADYMSRLPYVDAKRMAIAGGSYGGYMTNWVVGHTDRFKCAVTDRSICNWLSMNSTSDITMPGNGAWAPGTVWGNTEQQWNLSPLKYVANVKTPTLIIHSEGDLRCPISQGEEWFAALKWLKVETMFVRYPRETSHGMSRGGPIDLRFDRLTRIGEWLDKHLK